MISLVKLLNWMICLFVPVHLRGSQEHFLVRQMMTKGFSNILKVLMLAFLIALIQMWLFHRVCNQGVQSMAALEHRGLPNLNYLAALREDMVAYRLNAYQYIFARESERPQRQQAAEQVSRRVHRELIDLESHWGITQDRRYVTDVDTAFDSVVTGFEQIQKLVEGDFGQAMNLLDHDLPPRVQALDQTMSRLEHQAYQTSDSEVDEALAGFRGIQDQVTGFGLVNLVVTLGLVIFVVLAARRSWRQMGEALAQLAEQDRELHLLNSALAAAANGIVVTDAKGVIVWVNPAFTQLTGYTAEEAIGRSTSILKSGEHDKQFYADMWQTVTSGLVWHGELINRRKDGQHYHDETTITPIHDPASGRQYYVAIKQDVTQRKQSERELEREKKLLESLMDNLPDFIYFKDTESRFTRINQALTMHLGLQKPEQALGRTDADYMPLHESRQKLTDERRLLITGQAIVGLVERSGIAQNQRWVLTTKVPLHDVAGKIVGLVGVSRDITEHKLAELERLEMQSRFKLLFESSAEAILIADEKAILDCNPAALTMFNYADKADLVFRHPTELSPEQQPDGTESKSAIAWRMTEVLKRRNIRLEWVFKRSDGELFPTELSVTGFRQGDKPLMQAIIRDLTSIKEGEQQRKEMEVQLRQAQKLESIGQLAAGVAHEINTPIQYVGDNTRFLKEAFEQIVAMVHLYGELQASAKAGPVSAEQVAKLETEFENRDIEYLYMQIPTAIQETLEGVDRVSKIVKAMKEFSHPGGREKAAANLNRAIESTATVARNEWKYVADLELQLAPALPNVPCFLGEFNQVMLNLIVNAAHAIGDVVKAKPGTKGKIIISTHQIGDSVEVRVKDTGTGIAEKHRAKIFEPFFTTKDVGRGTGQGLSVVYSNIVKKHGGTVAFETEVGQGTTFIVGLPLNSTASTPEPAKS